MDLDDDLPTADVDRIAERRREERRAAKEAGAVLTHGRRDEDEDTDVTRGKATTGVLADR
jgi:hypothetical protein